MEIKQPTRHLLELCKELGSAYSIRLFDLEHVIYRDFKNGFDVEISGINASSPNKRANIFLWDNRQGHKIVEQIPDVPQGNISDQVNALFHRYGHL